MEVNVWLITTSLGVGAVLLYIQSNVTSLFLKSYRVTGMRQLRLITLSFIFFILATSSMLTINILLSLYYSEIPLKVVLIYREFSTFLYNVIFSIGLFFLLLSSTRFSLTTYSITPLITLPTLGIITSEETLDRILLINKYGRIAVDIVIIIEASFLLTLYLTYSEKEVITGKLWTLGILLIMFSRGVDILPTKPYSETFIIFMDMVAFILIYLMKKEAEIMYRGRT